LRTIPGLTLIRPADANETAAAWRIALKLRRPVGLLLSRQKLPILSETYEKALEGVERGAYVLRDSPLEHTEVILMASGSEVALALKTQELLAEQHIGARVVSMPSWELFEQQSLYYRLTVLPKDIPYRLAIEAGQPMGWERYVGPQGDVMGVLCFGASAPYEILQEKFGFTPQAVVERVHQLLSH